MRTYRKDSDDTVRHGIDWSDRLIEDDLIASSQWIIGQGLTGSGPTFTDVYSDIDLSGGTVNSTYKCTNEVQTAGGLAYTKSFQIMVVNK